MTVVSHGKGNPDFYVPTLPARPTTVDIKNTQVEWTQSTDYTITSEGSSIATFYTVPSGYKLMIGGGQISCQSSCIDRLRVLSTNSTIIDGYRFDMRGDIVFTDLTGHTIAAGEVITVYIYNNDSIQANFNLTMSGILELTS